MKSKKTNKLSIERKVIYANLESKIGRTPLEIYEGVVPNGNKIILKNECDGLFGTHYDRVYVDLFRELESSGIISPGTKVIETTSGSAGVSFAEIGKVLGYECFVAIPAGGEKARERALLAALPDEKHILFTPAESYVAGFPMFIKRFLVSNKDFVFLNHSMGKQDQVTKRVISNEITLGAFENITKELYSELGSFDYMVGSIGNGSSILGAGRLLKSKTKLVTYESFQSAVGYDKMYPGKYFDEYGIMPGILPRHKMPGTSYQGIDFPHINEIVESGLIDKTYLISDSYNDECFFKKTGREDTRNLLHWDAILPKQMSRFGRTTKAGLVVALDISKQVSDKTFVVLAYDQANRYDS